MTMTMPPMKGHPVPNQIGFLPETGVEDLDAAHSEYRELLARFTAKTGEAQAVRDRWRAAEQADTEASAEALRAGKKDPGQPHLEALVEEIAAVDREREVLAAAVNAAADDLAARFNENAGNMYDVYKAESRKAGDQLREALDGAEAALWRYANCQNALTIAASWPNSGNPDRPVMIQAPDGRSTLNAMHTLAAMRQIGADDGEQWVSRDTAFRAAGGTHSMVDAPAFDAAVEAGTIRTKVTPRPRNIAGDLVEYNREDCERWKVSRRWVNARGY